MAETQRDLDLVKVLAHITQHDKRGRHFTERVTDVDLEELETRGWIKIERPVHQPTGVPYGREDWSLEVTDEGLEQVDSRYDPRDDGGEQTYRYISASIRYIRGETSPCGEAVQAILDRLEDQGRASLEDYIDEVHNAPGVLTFAVAALTPEEYATLLEIPEADDVDVEWRDIGREQDSGGKGPSWNAAIYYCGRACELPAFKSDED